MIIGICGGSGSGKTTLAEKIVEAFGEDKVLLLSQDAYYKDRGCLPFEVRKTLNFDHPDALDSELLMAHLERLKQNHPIEQPVYDFQQHVRKPETITRLPRPVVLVEGILVFEQHKLRQLFDLTVFVDTDADIRFIRRLKRDVVERGRSLESVVQQYLQTVRPMHLEYVEPSKRYADIVIPEGGKNPVSVEIVIQRIKTRLAAPICALLIPVVFLKGL